MKYELDQINIINGISSIIVQQPCHCHVAAYHRTDLLYFAFALIRYHTWRWLRQYGSTILLIPYLLAVWCITRSGMIRSGGRLVANYVIRALWIDIRHALVSSLLESGIQYGWSHYPSPKKGKWIRIRMMVTKDVPCAKTWTVKCRVWTVESMDNGPEKE